MDDILSLDSAAKKNDLFLYLIAAVFINERIS